MGPTGLLVSTRSGRELPSRRSRTSWELLSTRTGPSNSQRSTSTLLLTSPSQTPSMPEPSGQSASLSSTTSVTSPTVDHAGLMEPPRPSTTVLASPPTERLPSSTQLLTPLLAAPSSHASQWAATVVKLAPHGTGSRTRVLSLEVTSVMALSASTTPWSSAPTTLHPQCQAATM